jgi:hypothetical protein
MKNSILIKLGLSLLLTTVLISCSQNAPSNRAVYLLIDTSGTYAEELSKAQAILNYLLATLDSGDSIAAARIDSGSFSEKDIIAKMTFDLRPSMANSQKRLFKSRMDQFVDKIKYGSAHTDITGGVLQAAEYLNETGAGEKYILVFSDLEEDLKRGHIRNFPITLSGIHVVALNVTKLRTDNIDPRDYLNRLAAWQQRVIDGGGDWRVVNDFDHLNSLIAAR